MNRIGFATTAKHPLTLVLDSRVQREVWGQRILQAAMSGAVCILDAGNCFNPLRLARQIRRQTIQIEEILDRIQVARAFTCFQVISLLEQTRSPGGPVFILRLLTTFNDEMVSVYERLRLLDQVAAHIDRLRRTAPVTVTIREVPFEEKPLLEWVTKLQKRADEVIFPVLMTPPQQARLF